MPHPRRYGTRMKPLVVIFALSPLLLAACGGSDSNCVDPKEPYLAARTNPALQIPEGLTQPNRTEALPIPADKGGANKAGSGACLDAPPSYFRSTGTVARSPEEVVASWAQA